MFSTDEINFTLCCIPLVEFCFDKQQGPGRAKVKKYLRQCSYKVSKLSVPPTFGNNM